MEIIKRNDPCLQCHTVFAFYSEIYFGKILGLA
jgi:hypothetical protein